MMLLLFSCSTDELSPDDEKSAATVPTDETVSDGVSIVKFDSDILETVQEATKAGKVYTKSMELNNVLGELGIVSMERYFPDAGEFEARTKAAGLDKWYKITYSPAVTRSTAEIELGSVHGVLAVEARHKLKKTSISRNDRYFNLQWDMFNAGSLGSGFTAGADINVEPVWESFTTGNPDVVVAVVDEGIQMDHPDLAGNTIPGGSSGSRNFCTESYVINAGDHGTHVAGTIAAIQNNSIGISGIAGGDYAAGQSGVKVMSCQIFDTDSKGKDIYGDDAEAIKWGADHGAVISQNSWGYSYEHESEAKSDATPQYFKDAVDYFVKYAGYDSSGKQVGPMAGGVVIFAAGNDGWQYAHPCDYEGVIAVGSFNADYSRSYYSNYGKLGGHRGSWRKWFVQQREQRQYIEYCHREQVRL